MGNTTHGASKGRAWVNGFEIGSYRTRSLGSTSAATRVQRGSQLYLIPDDYLTLDGKANMLVLYEDLGLAGGSGALEALDRGGPDSSALGVSLHWSKKVALSLPLMMPNKIRTAHSLFTFLKLNKVATRHLLNHSRYWNQ